MRKTLAFLLFTLFLLSCRISEPPQAPLLDLAKYVDPMIGTDWNGHTFPGATLPYGMVQLSPDTRTETWQGCSGYHYSDKSILGFSHTHFSGTGEGGGADIMFMPTAGRVQMAPGDSLDPLTGYRSSFSHENEEAEPGYYKVVLDDDGVVVELTAGKRVGWHRYTFPPNKRGNVILNLAHGNKDKADSLLLNINGNEISGWRAASGGLDGAHTVYFVARFSQPIILHGEFADGFVRRNVATVKGKDVRAFFSFISRVDNPLIIKVAISMVSIEGARKNLDAEAPGWDFDAAREKAYRAWNAELNKVQVYGGPEEQKKVFYTAMYHAFIHPNIYMDVDRKYRSTNGRVYTAKSFDNYTNFSLWDTFRALHPLQTIINQHRTTQFIRTFLERYKNSGNLPIMEFSGNERYAMIGYHSLPVIADAYVKGVKGFKRGAALKAMKKLADGRREGKNLYLQYGFIPYDLKSQSVSRTLEYAYDDWCVTRLTKQNSRDFHLYNQRGQFYKNVFRPDIGFMTPRAGDYSWLPDFDPMEGSHHYTEGNAYQYTPFVPQDIEGLIKLMGGDAAFEKWLDACFATPSDPEKMKIADVTGLIGQYAQGNEPSHHIAYLYNYAGAPWKTQEIVRRILTTMYKASPDGIPGNEDAGQMSAWFILSALGFYPVTPGMDYYVIGSPIFERAVIHLERGKTFEILAKNNSAENIYIQSATLNGKPLSKSWLRHADIIKGGGLEFTMGPQPNHKWGASREDRPPCALTRETSPPEIHAGEQRFLDSCTVTLKSGESGAAIRYTLDGSEPGKKSALYTHSIVLNGSALLKARCFVKGRYPGYTTSRQFTKLQLLPPLDVANPRPGVKYDYREGWCERTKDLSHWPVLKSGVMATFNVDSVKDSRAFGYNFKGYIKVPQSGVYIFSMESNDGAVLYIDGELLLDNDGHHPAQSTRNSIALAAGLHDIRLDYFQMGRAKTLLVTFKGPGMDEMREVSADMLFHGE